MKSGRQAKRLDFGPNVCRDKLPNLPPDENQYASNHGVTFSLSWSFYQGVLPFLVFLL